MPGTLRGQLRGQLPQLALGLVGGRPPPPRRPRAPRPPRTPSGAACGAPPRAARAAVAAAASRSEAVARSSASRCSASATSRSSSARAAASRFRALLGGARRPAARSPLSGPASRAGLRRRLGQRRRVLVALDHAAGAQELGPRRIGGRRLEQLAHAVEHRLGELAAVRARVVADRGEDAPRRLAVRRHRRAQRVAALRGPRSPTRRAAPPLPRATRRPHPARSRATLVERPGRRARLRQLRELRRRLALAGAAQLLREPLALRDEVLERNGVQLVDGGLEIGHRCILPRAGYGHAP